LAFDVLCRILTDIKAKHIFKRDGNVKEIKSMYDNIVIAEYIHIYIYIILMEHYVIVLIKTSLI